MSTKLYQGVRFKTKDIGEVMKHFRNVKETWSKMTEEFFSDYISQLDEKGYLKDLQSCILHKQFPCGEEKTFDDNIEKFYKITLNFIEEATGEFGLYVDEDGTIYGYPFIHRLSKLNDLVENPELMEEFGYWDNTDPPEDIPQEEFYARGEVWTRVMGRRTMGENALMITLNDSRISDPYSLIIYFK